MANGSEIDLMKLIIVIVIVVVFVVFVAVLIKRDEIQWWLIQKRRHNKQRRSSLGLTAETAHSPVRELNTINSRLDLLERQLRHLGSKVTDLEKEIKLLSDKYRFENRPTISRPVQQLRSEIQPTPTQSKVQPSPELTSMNEAQNAYQRLAVEGLRGLASKPIFADLDIDSSTQEIAIGKVKRCFVLSNTNQSPFVIFQKDSTVGWLFPNPNIYFTEAMGYVFPQLSHERFEELKNIIEPVQVRSTSKEAWEMLD